MIRIEAISAFLRFLPIAAFGGFLWDKAGLPLGWLLGAAFVTGALAISGYSCSVPKLVTRSGLVVIGVSVGLYVSEEVVQSMLGWIPVMFLTAVTGILFAFIGARLFVKWGGVTPATAFFSLLPGGVHEMANVADQYGGDRLTISVLHALRVGMIVTLIPFSLYGMNLPAVVTLPETLGAFVPLGFALLILTAALAGYGAQRMGLAAGWLVGPIIAGAVLSVLHFPVGIVPDVVSVAAQIVVGMSLGSRFKRDSIMAIPKAATIGSIIMLGIGVVMAGLAWIASELGGESLGTLILAFAGGGVAEMVLTAKSLSQNVALVAAFHIMRALMVNVLAGTIWRRLALYTQVKKEA